MKTAVEFLIDSLGIKKDGWNNSVIEQAKQMEKRQIMNAWDEVGFEWADSSEEYYNKIYKNTNDEMD